MKALITEHKNTLLQRLIAKCTVIVFVVLSSAVWSDGLTTEQRRFRELYQELVEINTTLSVGSCTQAAEAMAGRLKRAGYASEDIKLIVSPDWPKQGNLVVRLNGSSQQQKAILLLAHIDVVEADRDDWVRDPFTLVEEGGYFYGRGTADDKSMAAIFVDMLVQMKQSGYTPERTIKMALTCGEETPNTFNGVRYLLEYHRELIDAAFAINEGGGGYIDGDGKRIYHGIQAGEKVYQDYRLEITNPGGHSSRPKKDNAIYRLAAALGRVSAYEFPIEFNDTTKSYFDRMSKMRSGQNSKDLRAILNTPPEASALARVMSNPSYNSILHTTCVATMLDAGHAPNALPQRAGANVNCRIFPGHPQEEIRQVLERVVADKGIDVSFVDPPESTSPPPPLTKEIMAPIEKLSEELWPGVPVLPSMVAGGTDGRFLTPAGIPTYGVSGLFYEPSKVNAHGLNESVLVESLYTSRDFLNRLVRVYAGGTFEGKN